MIPLLTEKSFVKFKIHDVLYFVTFIPTEEISLEFDLFYE